MGNRKEYHCLYMGARLAKTPEARADYQKQLDALREKTKAAKKTRTAEEIEASKAHRREWMRKYANGRYRKKRYVLNAHTIEELKPINMAIRSEIDRTKRPMTAREFREWKERDDARFRELAGPLAVVK